MPAILRSPLQREALDRHAHLPIEIRPFAPRREQPVYLLRSKHRVYSPLV
jgi:hypothetical protein